jgi:hypothetical protein
MESTAPYSPAQNGIAERLNRTLLEHARAMIFAKQAPKILWPEAVAYACYIKNRTPTRALGADMTPFEAFFGKKPDIRRLEEFGKKCWVQVPDQRRTKLEPKSEQHIFTGIAPHAKAWRFYNVHTRHIQTSRNVIFDDIDNAIHPVPEDDDLVVGPPAGNTTKAAQPVPTPASAAAPPVEAAAVPVAVEPKADPRRSTRIAGRPVPDYRHMHEGERALSATEIVTEPASYAEALRRPDFPMWQKAMETEMEQHAEVGRWTLVELPAGKNVVGSQWVYAAKTNAEGTFDLGKARVVAQGFTQRPGMDYFEVTSPVVKLDSLRLILAIAIQKGWEIEMMDVKGAYLNSTLDEEIYMRQPDGFNDGSGRVLKLHRAIYGLKQSGRSWYKKLTTVLPLTQHRFLTHKLGML